MKNKKIIYYKTYEDDIVKNKNQDYNIKNNYKWVHNNIIYRFFSNILYVITYILSFFYCKN